MTWEHWVSPCDQSASNVLLTIRPDETHLGWSSVQHIYGYALGWDFPQPSSKGRRCTARRWVVIAYNSSNPVEGSKWLPVGPGGTLPLFHVWRTFAQTRVAPVQAMISDTNPQRRCLDYTELSWCNVSPAMLRAFISIPVPLPPLPPLLPFCWKSFYTAVYAHTTCKPRCTSMQRECNVGHQTEPTGRVLLFVSGEAAFRVKELMWRDACNKKKQKKQQRQRNTMEPTKASSTNC